MLGTAYPHQKGYPQNCYMKQVSIQMVHKSSLFNMNLSIFMATLPLTTINQLIFDIGYIGSL